MELFSLRKSRHQTFFLPNLNCGISIPKKRTKKKKKWIIWNSPVVCEVGSVLILRCSVISPRVCKAFPQPRPPRLWDIQLIGVCLFGSFLPKLVSRSLLSNPPVLSCALFAFWKRLCTSRFFFVCLFFPLLFCSFFLLFANHLHNGTKPKIILLCCYSRSGQGCSLSTVLLPGSQGLSRPIPGKLFGTVVQLLCRRAFISPIICPTSISVCVCAYTWVCIHVCACWIQILFEALSIPAA